MRVPGTVERALVADPPTYDEALFTVERALRPIITKVRA